MTDLEMVKKCAERMGINYSLEDEYGNTDCGVFWKDPSDYYITSEYDPLTDDAQAMALVKKFELEICIGVRFGDDGWLVSGERGNLLHEVWSKDLNRAIVECVAKLP